MAGIDTRRGTGRRRGFTAAAILSMAAAALVPLGASTAQAELRRVGPTDQATDIPRWYEDRTGLRLGPCDDAARCAIEAGTTVYWAAEAAMTGFGGEARLAMELASEQEAGLPPAVGASIDLRADGLRPGARYKVTYPFGVRRLLADAQGEFRMVDEAGCEVEAPEGGGAPPPCNFALALNGPIGPFLRWARGAPAGFIANGGPAEVTRRIKGSPRGTNFFRIEGPGLGRRGITTRQFFVMGEVVGAQRPDVARVSDTGRERRDNVTRDRTPTVRGLAEPGSTVNIFDGGDRIASGTATGGTYRITLPRMSQGRHFLRAAAGDGEVTSPSTRMALRVDSVAPRIRRVRVSERTFNLNRERRTVVSTHISEGAQMRVRIMRTSKRSVNALGPKSPRRARDVRFRWRGENRRGNLVQAGRYTLQVIAVDRAGNRSVHDRRTVRVVR